MSLINDALKRAGQAPPPLPPVRPITAKPPPVQTPPPSRKPVIIVCAIAAVILGLAGLFLVKGWRAARLAALKAASVSASAREIPDAATTGANRSDLTNNVRGGVKGAKGAIGSDTNGQLLAAQLPKTPMPQFKLKAIFYRPVGAAAVVNSKTVFVGDRVGQARVIAIDRDSVALEWSGRTNVLTLE